MEHDAIAMQRCLKLAERGRGLVGDGAMVGAVLVRDGNIVAEAFHAGFGAPHAERTLLVSIGKDVRPSDVLFVNLEPCCHEGKTPPCTEMIKKSGVRRVIVGMVDPDPRVSGKGIADLRTAGIVVMSSLLRAQCEWLNRGFVTLRTKGRPWITLKRAQTCDGRIAQSNGSPLRITNATQDAWSHTRLRAKHDAILVGVGTIVSDDPRLTVRCTPCPAPLPSPFSQEAEKVEPRAEDCIAPWRIVLDPNLRIPLSARIVNDEHREKTIVVCGPAAVRSSDSELRKRGVTVLRVPTTNGIFVWQYLWDALIHHRPAPKSQTSRLATQTFVGVTSILVEGGFRTWQAFRDAGMVDIDVTLIGQ